MSFTIMHRSGEMESDPSDGWIDRLLAELDVVDPEHPDIAVTHESGWSLSAFPSGLTVWQNVEDDHEVMRTRLTREQLIEAFRLLAAGNVAEVDARLRGLSPSSN